MIAILIVTLLGTASLRRRRGSSSSWASPPSPGRSAAATVAILGTAGLLAGYFPARRAAAIDPAATLRYE